MITLRKFRLTDQDYAILKTVVLAVWPDDSFSVEKRRFADQIILEKQRYWQRMIIEKEGQPIGYGAYCELWWADVPQAYYIDTMVHPDYQNQGAGSLFYDHAIRTICAERDVVSIATDTREDKPKALQFLTNRGFAQYARYPRSALDVPAFDPEPYAGLDAKMQALGIEIMPLSNLLDSDPDCKRKLWELEWIVAQDEPGPDAIAKKPFEEYVKSTFEMPGFSPESWFIAVDKGHYAGLSVLFHHVNNPTKMEQGWTGVDRPYRRKGVATALKLQTIAYAQAQGKEEIEADNFETNPMYQINMGLGFRPIPAWVSLRKMV